MHLEQKFLCNSMYSYNIFSLSKDRLVEAEIRQAYVYVDKGF